MSSPVDERFEVCPPLRGPAYSGLEFQNEALVVLYSYLVCTEGAAEVDFHKLLRAPYARAPTAGARVRPTTLN